MLVTVVIVEWQSNEEKCEQGDNNAVIYLSIVKYCAP